MTLSRDLQHVFTNVCDLLSNLSIFLPQNNVNTALIQRLQEKRSQNKSVDRPPKICLWWHLRTSQCSLKVKTRICVFTDLSGTKLRSAKLVVPFKSSCVIFSETSSRHLFKVALHGFVCQQQDGPHQVSHQDEISFGLQVKSHDVVVVVTLGPQLLLSRPLVQTDLEEKSIKVIVYCYSSCQR